MQQALGMGTAQKCPVYLLRYLPCSPVARGLWEGMARGRTPPLAHPTPP